MTGINALGNQPFPEIRCGGGKGGMSGPVIADIARQHLQIVRAREPYLAYLSCGGIDSDNAAYEIPLRLQMGALLIGGNQEFYRSDDPVAVAGVWRDAWAN